MILKFSAIKEIFTLIVDEFRKIFADSGVMLLLFGATLIYPLIYSVAYHTELLSDAPIAVVDEDNSFLSREYVRMVDATPEVSIFSKEMNLAEANNKFFAGDVAGILVIPSDFSNNIAKGNQAMVSVYADASYMMLYKQVFTATAVVSKTLGKKIEVKKRLMQGVPLDNAIEQSNPVAFSSRRLYNPTSGYGSYALPGILVLILQQSLLIGVGMRGGTARELGAKHFLLPLKSSRKGVLRIIIAKTIVYVAIYIPVSFYLFVVIFRIFGLPLIGKPSDLFVLILPLVLSIIMLAFFITTFFRNRENSIVFLLFTSVPLLFLSGFSWPVESFPFGFKALSMLFPSTHGIRGLLKIEIMGAHWQSALPEIATLWTMAVCLFFVNWIVVRYKMTHGVKKQTV